jgi:hypothetical protein
MRVENLILNFLELTAFIIGLLNYKKIQQSYYKLFVYLLGFIFLSEMVGKFLKINGKGDWNNIWYGLFVIPTTFISYYVLFAKKNNNKIYLYFSILVLLTSLFIEEFILNHKNYYFTSMSYMIGSILLLLSIFNYFYSLLKGDSILTFKKDPFFWISVGILLFYLPTFPFYGFNNYLKGVNMKFYLNYYYFAIVLNCIMYICFSIGLKWENNK